MSQEITQRQLRNESGDIMRGLDRGETYLVTRNGVLVGELRPIRRDQYVAAEIVAAMFGHAPPIAGTFRDDVDRVLDQDPTPRG